MSNEKIKQEALDKIKELQNIIDKLDKEPRDIKDKIKTMKDVYEHFNIKTHGDAYKILGLNRKLLYCQDIDDCEDNWLKIALIAKALNGGWEPNWLNSNEYKYYPYFRKNPSGSGFSYNDFDYWNANTFVGSRLCYKTSDLAAYAGKQFEAIYSEYVSI